MFRRTLIVVFSICAVASFAANGAAAVLPAHAEVRAGRCVEAASFRRLVANRYHVEFSHVVAADIDRDGDIDVIATTDHTFTVWVNDGAGRLTSQRPAAGPALDGQRPATTWRDRAQSSDPSNNDEGPSTPVLVLQPHAPPVLASGAAALIDFSAFLNDRDGFHASRAPPRRYLVASHP